MDAAWAADPTAPLTAQEQLDATRDVRIRQRWEAQQQEWARVQARVAARTGRSASETLVATVDGYRELVEVGLAAVTAHRTAPGSRQCAQ